jgi:predicted ferric reductase
MRPPLLLDAHQFLSTAAVGFASFHGLVLMGDRYVSFPLLAIVVPFAGSYEPLLVACGQIAMWLSVLLIGSFHLRRHLGGQAWRRLHYASFVAFWLACVHGLALGSESATLWASLLYLGTAAPVIFLCLYRVLSTPRLQGLLIENSLRAR